MIKPRLFLCSDTELNVNPDGREIVKLNGLGPNYNVNIRIEDVARVFLRHISPRLVDLLEIASYIYAADCATRRCSQWSDDVSMEPWDRDFHFVIPVRDVDFWQQSEIIDLLSKTLKFLSNDDYKFDFPRISYERQLQEYLQFSEDEDWPFYEVERVLMFSGGLDSLAGAVLTAEEGENLVLVSHRPVGTLDKRQKALFDHIKKAYTNPMIHIPVWINKTANLGREHTQRTRSFLYSALGTVVAESLRARGVRFFENGVVSLNLPVADEVLRARASKTTHPLTLTYFSQLYSLVVGREFIVDNPFLFHTKTDIVHEIVKRNNADLIQYTCSCAHSMFQSKNQWHCGTCSQCIDRRIAIMAAHQNEFDPETDYVTNVFTGERKEGYEQNMAVGYVRHAVELQRMTEQEISNKFSLELARAVQPFSGDRRRVHHNFVDLHKRHGQQVSLVLQKQIEINSGLLVSGDLPEHSMLRLVVGSEHLTSTWKRFAKKMLEILKTGIPIAFQTTKPENEPRLQEICDSIISTHESDLVREFPFMRWSATATKPDWSSESLGLWIELKYVRVRKDLHSITEAIAADITKYGDNGRRVLFIIYDPNHLIVDDDAFAEPIRTKETMEIDFVR